MGRLKVFKVELCFDEDEFNFDRINEEYVSRILITRGIVSRGVTANVSFVCITNEEGKPN